MKPIHRHPAPWGALCIIIASMGACAQGDPRVDYPQADRAANGGQTIQAYPLSGDSVAVNQYAFAVRGPKVISLEGREPATLKVEDANGALVLEVSATPLSSWDGQPRSLLRFDISALDQAGDYRALIDGLLEAIPFRIRPNPWTDLYVASLRTFMHQRASISLGPEVAGPYTRPAGHPDSPVTLAPSTGAQGSLPSPGGWYDAGDYGKYVVNGGISVATLLLLAEIGPSDLVRRDDLGIPESGNGVPDLLDEVRWELDWFKTMQAPDGGVYFKVAGKQWPGFVAPSADTMERFVFGKSTASTLNFAAVMAQAGRIYRNLDPAWARDSLDRALRAWEWALANPSVPAPTDNSGSGGYGDGDFTDEFFWASAELAASGIPGPRSLMVQGTGFPRASTVKAWYQEPVIAGAGWWGDLRNHGIFTLALHGSGQEREKAAKAIHATAGDIAAYTLVNPYRSPLRLKDFVWGSNGAAGNYGLILAMGHHLASSAPPNQGREYSRALADIVNYLLGHNATGHSFVTGFGHRTPRRLHNRLVHSFPGLDPIPGFLVGGPNFGREDRLAYPGDLPEKSWLDHRDSYASNETAINWNAPLTLMAAVLHGTQEGN